MPFADVIAQFRAVVEDHPWRREYVLPVPKNSIYGMVRVPNHGEIVL
jgi:hypothetical protein